jgi:hypothetical protein
MSSSSPEPTEAPRIMVCPLCRGTENYFGRIVFPGETGQTLCPNHTSEGESPSPLVEVDTLVVQR